MPDTLSYSDAVRLLGGGKSRFVDWFDKLTGGALLAASVPVPALLGVFDAKAEFVRLGHELLRTAGEKRSGLSRYGRTQRLEAAHAVIAVTAFFEALEEIGLPADVAALRVSKAEQLALAGAGAVVDDALTDALFATAAPLPGPHLPYPDLRAALTRYYDGLVGSLLRFLRGLVAWEDLEAERRRTAEEHMLRLPTAAVDRHRDLLTQLATDFPEVTFWIGLHEHEATRTQVRSLSLGLTDLRKALSAITTGDQPDERRAALAAAYAAELRRPIVSSGDVPAGLTVPTLGESYVPPLCRIEELGAGARPADESWWDGQTLRDDLWQSLVVHLTSPAATRAPLLVLGQPGSGKSVLTRVLAAQLPAADFLVVRVVLREVYAAGDLQDQIEQAVRDDTGDRTDWRRLSRSAADALPVVLLDGFDELLQATGVSQTDYLRRVANFQLREADQGRPVAVLVTSRTSVADRAQPPPGTVAVRLEPFDEMRVHTWVTTWNRANRASFRALGVQPLDPATVLAHGDLAGQPLLLLMLALYDAEGNDLRDAGELRRGELYERLLRRFARREITKQRDGLPERELDRAVEEELRRLAVVAFAMFNRRAQWVSEQDLDADLAALSVGGTAPADRSGLRSPLRGAEVVLGRFFFIHRSRASTDDGRRETYEFLHATFGEYLVARFTWKVVDDLVAREAASIGGLGGAPVDDDLLHALLSHAVLTIRAPVLGFLTERLASRDDEWRSAWTDLLLRLFRSAPYESRARRLDSYRPSGLTVPARYAVYSANLLVLALCVGDLSCAVLYSAPAGGTDRWRRDALWWRAQLPVEDHLGLLAAVRPIRTWAGRGQELILSIRPPDEPLPARIDLRWQYGSGDDAVDTDARYVYAQSGNDIEVLHHTAYFECDRAVEAVLHVVEPFDFLLSEGVRQEALARSDLESFYTFPEGDRSEARLLLDVALASLSSAGVAGRERAYERLVATFDSYDEDPDQGGIVALLLERMTADIELPPGFVAGVLRRLAELYLTVGLQVSTFRCVLAFLGRDRQADLRFSALVPRLVVGARGGAAGRGQPADWLDEFSAEVLVRLYELELRRDPVSASEAESFRRRCGARRPDLVGRLRPLADPNWSDRELSHRQDGVGDAVAADD
ncbi:AAA family ATPase [Micromonospora sp. NPDC049374]|uniref:NACHT domain-containing protein n=1 Tax=Micromonospora sp. NPDC049374 TaxID=3154352 RepID=UPI003423A481